MFNVMENISHFDSIATKTANVRMIPVSDLIDSRLIPYVLLNTLEGNQPIGAADAVLCVGANNEAWQQTRNKFDAKYNIIDQDEDGWFIGQPKPDNSVYCFRVTADMITHDDQNYGRFVIRAQWGTEVGGKFYQSGEIGDYICQNPYDPADVWIVKGALFEATYEITGPLEK